MKKCSNCKLEKSKINFPKRKTTKDGLDYRCKQCQKDYYLSNKNKINNQRKLHYQENKSSILASKKLYSDLHKQEKSQYDIIYREQNKEKIAKYKKDWENKNKNNPSFKIVRNLRRRISHALNGDSKSENTIKLLGCSVEYFKKYLESKFKEHMSWDNYGQFGWHIDHIIPCSKFDLSKEEEQKKCFHYTNMQPLWWKDNLKKGKKLTF